MGPQLFENYKLNYIYLQLKHETAILNPIIMILDWILFYLTPIVPFRVDRIDDGFGPEALGTHVHNGIRIRFAFAQHTDVLLHQIFGLNHVNAQNSLSEKIMLDKYYRH